MAAQIGRHDPQRRRQGRQQGAVGQGVETVGVQENHIDRTAFVAEVEHRHVAIAPGAADGDHPPAWLLKSGGVHGGLLSPPN